MKTLLAAALALIAIKAHATGSFSYGGQSFYQNPPISSTGNMNIPLYVSSADAQGNSITTTGSIQDGGSLNVKSTETIQGAAFSVGGSTFVVTNGRAGVGISNPAQTLDVLGGAKFGSGIAQSTFNATPNGTTYALNVGSGVFIASGSITLGNSTGYIQFGDRTVQMSAAPTAASIGWTRDASGVIYPTTANDNVTLSGTSTMTVMGAGFSVGKSTLSISNGQVFIDTDSTSNMTGILNVMNSSSGSVAPAVAIISSSTGNTLQIQRKGRLGSSSTNGISLTDEDENSTTFGITSVSTGVGVAKITHNYQGDSDVNGALISMRRNGAGTQEQILFWDNDTSGDVGVLTKTINGRTNSTEYFVQYSSGETILNGQGTAPKAELHIISTGTLNGTANFRVDDNAGNRIFEVMTASVNSPTSPYIRISSSNGTALMMIQQNGNVGIGKTNPAQLLDVNSTILATNFQTSGSLFNNSSSNNSRLAPGANGAILDRNQSADTNTKSVFTSANLNTGSPLLGAFLSQAGSMTVVSNDGAVYASAFWMNASSAAAQQLIAFSSVPIMSMTGYNSSNALASGTTFYTTIMPSAVRLVGLIYDPDVASSGGSGDTFTCGDGSGNLASVVSGNGLTVFSSATINVAIKANTIIQCYLTTGATTKPVGNLSIPYKMQ